MTDFHSHILPGMDDGCKTVEDSVLALKMMAEQGIKRVAATPHFYAAYSGESLLNARPDSSRTIGHGTMFMSRKNASIIPFKSWYCW